MLFNSNIAIKVLKIIYVQFNQIRFKLWMNRMGFIGFRKMFIILDSECREGSIFYFFLGGV